MSDLAVLMKQHTQIGEGLAALQMLTSHLPDAVMVSSTKDHPSLKSIIKALAHPLPRSSVVYVWPWKAGKFISPLAAN